MNLENIVELAFFGDDFTGSTDALEFLSRAGLRTVLVLDDPTPEMLKRFGNLDAMGVAGMTRAMPPEEISKTLEKSFSVLKRLNPRHIHYKVCSTFDSSPETGSIGTAIETGQKIFQNKFTPVLVAAPHLGRFSAFGNLYARMGIGSQGAIHRLDRHPSMCAHPITPATESDLRLHLAKQTKLSIGLIDLVDLENPEKVILAKLNNRIDSGDKILFFDAMYKQQMKVIGKIFDYKAGEKSPLFSVGSSGVEKALGDHWASEGKFEERTEWEPLSESKPLLVLSGSVSPVTADQIIWAGKNGFELIGIELEGIQADNPDAHIEKYLRQSLNFF